jgi:beta-mannosidase
MRKLALLALVAALTACQPPSPSVYSVELSEGWSVSGADTFTAGFPAQLPGTIHTDLLANNFIEDPFWRDNEMKLQWIGEEDWSYRNTFLAGPELLEAGVVELVFRGLDTFARVELNGRLLLESDNMFREWRVDVTRHLLTGENRLEVHFRSPLPEALAAHDALPYTLPAGNDLGDPPSRVFVRKAAFHYGWDWGPRFVTSGIWRPVELVAWRGARLTNLHLTTDSLSPEMALLTAQVEVEATRAEAERRQAGGSIPVTLTLSSPQGSFSSVSHEAVLEPGINLFTIPLNIPDPELWWPNGLGDHPLYTVQAALDMGLRVDSLSTRIGLRSVELVTRADSVGESFFFEVNGIPVFMKGANYIPLDHFTPRVGEEEYRALFGDVVKANMNMLRIWGGGIYEEDLFYDLADEEGILIWQDFMFANGMYPGDSAFLANVRDEATYQLRRLRGHPSIALWCGNNEMEEGWQRWGWARAYDTPEDSSAVREAYEAIFHQTLPQAVAREDPSRRYWPSSPSLGWGDPESLNRGDSHYWGIWHGREPFEVFTQKLPRFSSEFGFQAFPSMETVAAFTDAADRSLFNPILLVHQKHPIGNELISEYMERDYPVPSAFEDFTYLSQLLQARGMQMAFEAHRRAMPRTMGTLYWQLNDSWPVVSWSGRDYFGGWKALHYAARDAFAPILISPYLNGDTVEIWGVSDVLEPKDGMLTLRLLDFRGATNWEATVPATLSPGTSQLLWSMAKGELLQGSDPAGVVLSADFGGERASLFYFLPPKGLALEIPAIQMEWEEGDGGIRLTLSSDVLAKDVYLSIRGSEEDESPGEGVPTRSGPVFSDNFFDLLPGQPTTIRITTGESLDETQRRLRIRTLAEVPKEGVAADPPPAG